MPGLTPSLSSRASFIMLWRCFGALASTCPAFLCFSPNFMTANPAVLYHFSENQTSSLLLRELHDVSRRAWPQAG